jgi:hypothetical protein
VPVPEWKKVYLKEMEQRKLLYQARVLGWGKESRIISRTKLLDYATSQPIQAKVGLEWATAVASKRRQITSVTFP